MQKIIPVIWFKDNTQEAVDFYTNLFDNSKIGDAAYYDEASSKASGQPKGSLLTADFELEGLQFTALNGGPAFSITPAISFTVQTTSEEKIDRLWQALSEDGVERMALEKYPFSEKYGWIEDRFGVNWQLMLLDEEPEEVIVPSLLYVGEQFGRAKEAMKLYTSLFANSEIKAMAKYSDMGEGAGGGADPNAIAHASFTLEGEIFYAMDGPGEHDYTFTNGISLMVNCETQEEIDKLWSELSKGGEIEQCGWLKDKFGVSWQIVPTVLPKLLSDPDPEKAARTMEAMLEMKKLDISELEKAHSGKN